MKGVVVFLHHLLAATSLSSFDLGYFLSQDSAPAVTEAAGSGSWESLQTLQNGFHADRDLPNGISFISIFLIGHASPDSSVDCLSLPSSLLSSSVASLLSPFVLESPELVIHTSVVSVVYATALE